MSYKDRERQNSYQANWVGTCRRAWLDTQRCGRCQSRSKLRVRTRQGFRKPSWSRSGPSHLNLDVLCSLCWRPPAVAPERRAKEHRTTQAPPTATSDQAPGARGSPTFQKGQRVRYSPEGLRALNPKQPDQQAVVLALGTTDGKPSLVLRRDGCSFRDTAYAAFWEPVPGEPLRRRGRPPKAAAPIPPPVRPALPALDLPGRGEVRHACGHVVKVGYGPARVSGEQCRDCLEAAHALGPTAAVFISTPQHMDLRT